MKLFLAIMAFNIIVIIHELGHYLVAKWAGIKVYEFSLFMGPKIYSFQHKETTFSIRLIPMLAYVAFDKEDSVYEDRSLSKHPIPARAAVMAAGSLFNILSATVALAIMLTLSGFQTTEINRVVKDSAADRAGVEPGDRIVSFDGMKIFQPLEVEVFLNNLTEKKAVDIEVLREGHIIPLKLTPRSRHLIGFTAQEVDGERSNVIESLIPGSPAEQAGLKTGDIIVKLDNEEISNMQQILDFLSRNEGKPLTVSVIREGELRAPVEITPMQMLSTDFYFSYKRGNIAEIAGQALFRTYSFTRIGLHSFVWLVQGKVPVNQMMGAVGAVDAINTAVQQSTSIQDVIVYLLSMMALISIALGVTNLLPIPPADGSKLLLLAIEAIRRKPIPQEKEAFIMMAGFALMMVVFAFTLYNDIARIVVRVLGG